MPVFNKYLRERSWLVNNPRGNSLGQSNLIGWTKMHDIFKSLLPRYFLKDIYVKWSQFEFQTIWSNFHYSPRRLKFLLTIIVLAKFRLKMIFEFFLIKVSQKLYACFGAYGPPGPIEGVGPQTPNFFLGV